MGTERARAAAKVLVAQGASALLVWGTAGALDPALRPGTLSLPKTVVGRSGREFSVDAGWHCRVRTPLVGGTPLCTDAMVTAPEVAASVGAKRALRECYQAAVVDMESAAVAEVAQQSGLPFLTLRAIVDPAERPLPRAVLAAMAGADGSVRLARFFWEAVARPQEWPALWRLGGYSRQARRSLDQALRQAWGPLLTWPGAGREIDHRWVASAT
jgi:adenosylhomocysteine nucleosidase